MVNCVCVHHQANCLQVCIWELRTRSVLKTVLGHTDTVKSIAFNPQQQNVAIPVVASAGGCTVRLSDLRPSHKTDIITLTPHSTGREVEAVAISPDGTLLASGGRDGLIVLHNLFVPSVLPRSESYRTSSAFVRTSRTFSNKPTREEEDNEADENDIVAEVAALDNILTEPKAYTKLKRLSRTEEKGVEIPIPTEKRVGPSAKKSRAERAKGKSADIANTVTHLMRQDPLQLPQPSSLLASETIASKVVAFSSSAVPKTTSASRDKKYTQPVDLPKLRKQFEKEELAAEIEEEVATGIPQVLSSSSIPQVLSSSTIPQVLSSSSIPYVTSSIIDESENEEEDDGLTMI